MGLLTNSGDPIMWDDPRRAEANSYVLHHGIIQFINLYKRNSGIRNKPFLWGDELEYLLIKRKEEERSVALSLRGDELLAELQRNEDTEKMAKWHPEYGSFMVESTPYVPHEFTISSLAAVERGMQSRYDYLLTYTASHQEIPLLMTTYPLMGVGEFTFPKVDPQTLRDTNQVSKSLFVPDACINKHPRFATLTKNIRLRRNRKVCIQIPILLDTKTLVDPILNIDSHPANRFIEGDVSFPGDATRNEFNKRERQDAINVTPSFTQYYYAQYYGNKDAVRSRYEASPSPAKDVFAHPSVYMDCMAFGMGCCCLQVTMQLSDLDEARYVYDQLAVFCPIMLAITAGTAIQKGILTDNDVRWMTVSEAVDDRTPAEVPRIVKSRYDSISTFIGTRCPNMSAYNDCKMETSPESFKQLVEAGVDEVMARHVAHLFIRDPLVIYDGKLGQLDDATASDHFENIQSTNWQTVRFKPPPSGESDIGWRVEFRVMEVSITSFENAAFSNFVILFSRAIIKYNLCLYVPLSVVDMNLAQAHRRDAVLERRFIWRVNMTDPGLGQYESLLVDEIINGCPSKNFKGIAFYVLRILAEMEAECAPGDQKTMKDLMRLRQYIEFVRRKASGKIKTAAAFFRQFVKRHPKYNNDSKVTDEIAYDIVSLAYDMSCRRNIPEDFIPAELFNPL